jgi:hypothetical protein
MRVTRTAAALSMLVIAGTALSLPVEAQGASCGWYADTAIKQQQRNEQGKCGFTGAAWNSNRQAHLSWCATQTPDRWKSEAQKREQMLAGCKR